MAETHHLSRAATVLHMAQPALSRQIHELERELGVQLLDRHPRGVTPTAAGDVLARGSAQLLRDVAGALDRAENAAAGRSGRVVVGAPRVALVGGIAGALERALREHHPDISLVVRETEGVDGWDLVVSGDLDVCLGMYPATNPLIHMEPLWEERMSCALIPASHPLASRARVTAAELSDLPFLIPPRGVPSALIEVGMSQLIACGLRSPLVTLESGVAGAHLMVAAGRGWFVVTETLAASAPPGTSAPVLEGLRILVPLGVAWKRNERRPAVRHVIEFILDFARRNSRSHVREMPVLPPAPPVRAHRRRKPGTAPVELEIRHLVALLEVAALQSIGRAADRLGVTQSALSRQLQELESALGFALLHRGARGVSLTAGGTALASECPALLGAVERLTRETTRARRGMAGHCVIGAVSTAASAELLGRVLTHCAVHHPHLSIVIDEVTTPEQAHALRQGRIDLGLMHSAALDEGHVSRETIRADKVDGALVGAAHPLASKTELTAADLANVPFLWMSEAYQPQFHELFTSGLAAIGLDPLVLATYEKISTIWTGVARGLGWCLASRSTRLRPPAGTVAIRIAGLDVPWGLDIAWRKDERGAAVHAVIEAFRAARAGDAAPAERPPRKQGRTRRTRRSRSA